MIARRWGLTQNLPCLLDKTCLTKLEEDSKNSEKTDWTRNCLNGKQSYTINMFPFTLYHYSLPNRSPLQFCTKTVYFPFPFRSILRLCHSISFLLPTSILYIVLQLVLPFQLYQCRFKVHSVKCEICAVSTAANLFWCILS